ncbi:hypothetical protein [Priestia megaterium]|uniref:Uncharacterized protein n=1 Tax=Priestia megaterium TaxID=1404 RepID=A0A6M6E278_PRIMG|nr:hypothetical protein [Priestia megaterium]QJX80910.1 hypothetical protein FDZ14_32995 [Priestia megaterium]
MVDLFLLVVHHEEEVFFYSQGEFADQYYDEFKKVEKYEFYSKDSLMGFLQEQEQENKYGNYKKVEVTSY